MERIEQINPDRLQWALDDRDVAVEQLAGKTGIAESTLIQVLGGESGLTFKQLKKVSDYFGRGVLFFLEPGPAREEMVRSPQFRTLSNQKPNLPGEVKALIERVSRLREVYLDLLENEEDRPRFDPPDLRNRTPGQAAEAVRDWLGLDTETKPDFGTYRQAVENRGLLVFLSTGYAGTWKFPTDSRIAGFSLYFRDCPLIAVRKQRPETRQSFTLMHELGHLLLHRDSFIDEEDDLFDRRGREREANAFAGYLLVPDDVLAQIDDQTRPADPTEYGDWLAEVTGRLGVSTEVILRRLLDANRLSQRDYQAYRQCVAAHPQAASDGGARWRDREPLHMFGPRYVGSVLGALQSRQITLSKASSYLDNLKVPDIHKLERHLAGP